MSVRMMNDIEFQRHAVSILKRELGIKGFARFLRLYRCGLGDYTKERNGIRGGATVDDIVEQVRSATLDQTKQ